MRDDELSPVRGLRYQCTTEIQKFEIMGTSDITVLRDFSMYFSP
jgi:hypothetical protein